MKPLVPFLGAIIAVLLLVAFAGETVLMLQDSEVDSGFRLFAGRHAGLYRRKLKCPQDER